MGHESKVKAIGSPAWIRMFMSSKLFMWHFSRRIVRMESAEKKKRLFIQKSRDVIDWKKRTIKAHHTIKFLHYNRILFVGRGRG